MENRVRHSRIREESTSSRPGPARRLFARALVAGVLITGSTVAGPAVRDAMAQGAQDVTQKTEAVGQKIDTAELTIIEQEAIDKKNNSLKVDSKNAENKLVVVELLDSLVDLGQTLGQCEGKDAVPVKGGTNEEKFRALNGWLNKGADEPLDFETLQSLRENLNNASACYSAKGATEEVSGGEGGAAPATEPGQLLPPGGVPPYGPVAAPTAPAETEDTGQEGKSTDVDRTGFFNRSYRYTPIRPLLPSGDYLYSQGMAENTYAVVNKRAVSMFDLDVSGEVGLAALGYSTYDGYLYAKGGMRYSALRAQVRGQYNDGKTPPVDWPVTTQNFLKETEGGVTTGYFELHHLFLFGDDSGPLGMDLREGKGPKAQATEGKKSVYGLDVSFMFGVARSTMMGLTVPYPTAGGPPGEGQVEERSEVSYPMGFELRLPRILGDLPPVWLEGAGYSFNPTGELHNVYLALTGNFSNHVRLGFVPRFQDTLGAKSFVGEVHLDYRPVREVTLTAGALPGYTNMDGTVTRMFGGYGEVGFGTGLPPFEGGQASLRGGYLTEFGDDKTRMVLPSAFVQLSLSGSLPSLF